MSRPTPVPAVLLGLSLVLGASACSPGPDRGDQGVSPTSYPTAAAAFGAYRGERVEAGQFRPGLSVVVDEPAGGPPTAVVVLVPGGGWSSADPTGLAPLARTLADGGFLVITVTYGTSGTGEYYPVPPDDVACGVGFAAKTRPGLPVVLVGHSAGAQLVALVGLVPHHGDDLTCPSPAAQADAVVGLAGPYDIGRTGGLARALVGVDRSAEPALWDEADPLVQAGSRPEVPFLLVHGMDDPVVPVSFTTDFSAALKAGGHHVTVDLLPGVDHSTVLEPAVVGDLISTWIAHRVVGASS